MKEDELRAEIVKFGALLYGRGLAHGSAGNLSVKLSSMTSRVDRTPSTIFLPS